MRSSFKQKFNLIPLPCALLVMTAAYFGVIFHPVLTAQAAIPKTINFQGKITKTADGTNVADGNYSMQFKIYDQPTGGNLLWTETWDGTNGSSQVSLTSGVFTVKLGSYTSLASVDFTGGSLYLTVNFNPGAGYDGEMLPRKQLVAAAFAFNANSLVGDGRIGIITTSTTQSAMQVTYNPDTATATPAAVISASSNETGPALKVIQGGSGYAALFTGGNIGVGTSTPIALLSVASNSTSNPTVLITATSSQTSALFTIASSTGSILFQVAANGSTTVSSLAVAGFVKSTSGGSLYIDATSYQPAGSYVTNSYASSTFPSFAYASSSYATAWNLIAGSNVTITTSTPGQITIAASGTGGGVSASGTPGMIQFYGSTSALNANQLFAWDNTNLKLSVGTTSTASTLSIQGKAGSSDLLDVATSTGWSLFHIAASGMIGIATSTPSAVLDIQGTPGSTSQLIDIGSSSGASYLHVMSTGNVGIGTSTPTQTLQVIGTASVLTSLNNSFAFQVQNASSVPIFVVDTTNNVNLIGNPGFENNTSGWSASGTSGSIARITAHKYYGVASLQVNTPATATSGAYTTLFTAALQSTTQYTLSFFARVDAASSSFTTLSAGWSNTGTGVTACALNSTTVVNNGWQRYTCTFTTGTISGTPNIFIGQSDAVSRTFYIDSVQLQTGNSVTPYQVGGIQLRGIITNPVTFSAGSNSSNAFQIQDTAGTMNLFVANTINGRIGIGTSTPVARLSIQHSTTTFDAFDIASSTGASFMRVTFNGRVGINTTSPVALLAVQGDNRGTNLFTVASSTGSTSTYFTVISKGYVGVGTSSPVARFAVAANCFNFASTTQANSKGLCTDYAEFYPSSEAVDKAEIVSAGTVSGGPDGGLIKKSHESYDPAIIGIVSSNPAVIVEGNSVQFMNGSDYTVDPYHPAIALAGRVPLKIVSSGSIHAGDFITSSDIPGVGMKATHSGEVIGQALENFDPTVNTSSDPAIMVFVHPGYQVIGDPVDWSALSNLPGLDFGSTQTGSADILRGLLSDSSDGQVRYLATDRVVAGLDITTPQLTAKSVNADTIAPALGSTLAIALGPNGSLVVGSGLSIDAAGNANFAGAVTAATATVGSLVAGHISSPDMVSLFQSLSDVGLQASSTAAVVTGLEQQIGSLSSSTAAALMNIQSALSASSSQVNLQDLVARAGQGLTFSNPVTFAGGLRVGTISGLDSGSVTINGDTYFIGTPYFNTDTAGFAVIRQGATSVDIGFDRPYLETPIVNASIAADASSTGTALDQFTNSIFGGDIRYLIINKSEVGFTILLNKPAPVDVPFSWMALLVRGAKTFSSIASVAPVPVNLLPTVPGSGPQVLGDTITASTTSDQATSTGQNQVDDSPAATSTAINSSSGSSPSTTDSNTSESLPPQDTSAPPSDATSP